MLRWQAEQAVTCADCGKDISDRLHSGRGGQSAYLCLECAYARKLDYQRRHNREIYRDPVLAARRKAYASAWLRAKKARRVLETVICTMCGRKFQMNRIGRRRLVCVGCSAINEGYVSVTRYMATAKRRTRLRAMRRRAA